MTTSISEAFGSATTGTGRRLKPGPFLMSMSGGVGTVKLQLSYDGGSTYFDASLDSLGTIASYVLNSTSLVVSGSIPGGADGVFGRFNATAYTSGTLTCRIDQ
jgi:hypothetical protein